MFPKLSTFYGPFDWRIDSLMAFGALAGSFFPISMLNDSVLTPVQWIAIASATYAFAGVCYALKSMPKVEQRNAIDWIFWMVLLFPTTGIFVLSLMMRLSGAITNSASYGMIFVGCLVPMFGSVLARATYYATEEIWRYLSKPGV